MKRIISGLLLTASMVFAGNYEFDAGHSKIGFKVKHLSITNVYGTFDKVNANIVYDEKTKQLTALKSTIAINSVDTKDAKRDAHLKEEDFFDAKKFPNMTFELLEVKDDTLIANLTIKGITKQVEFDYENNGIVKDPWGNTKLGFSLEAKINRVDFGLKTNKILDSGGLLIGEKVKITADIEAQKIQ
jgi:polyisoprenoid-binding protein YceI